MTHNSKNTNSGPQDAPTATAEGTSSKRETVDTDALIAEIRRETEAMKQALEMGAPPRTPLTEWIDTAFCVFGTPLRLVIACFRIVQGIYMKLAYPRHVRLTFSTTSLISYIIFGA